MAISAKILGQDTPAASTETVLYTVPAGKQVSLSVWICNTNASAAAVRVHLLPSGTSTPLTKHRIISKSIDASDTLTTAVITLGAGDKVSVWSDAANVAFNVNGFEESVA
jgi:hypothetical protein